MAASTLTYMIIPLVLMTSVTLLVSFYQVKYFLSSDHMVRQLIQAHEETCRSLMLKQANTPSQASRTPEPNKYLTESTRQPKQLPSFETVKKTTYGITSTRFPIKTRIPSIKKTFNLTAWRDYKSAVKISGNNTGFFKHHPTPEADYSHSQFVKTDYIEKHDYFFINKPGHKCENVNIVLCTFVPPFDIQSRKRLRKERREFLNNFNATQIFFLGIYPEDENNTYQSLINLEAKQHNDIVQENYIDSYRNLSIKSMSIAKWVTQHCATAMFVIKSDPDVDAYYKSLVKAMRRQFIKQQTFVIGQGKFNAEPDRNRFSKWFVAKKDFPGKYPNFVLGPTYGYTMSAAELIFKASQEIKFFVFEDVFLGMCAKHMNISIVEDGLFTFVHH